MPSGASLRVGSLLRASEHPLLRSERGQGAILSIPAVLKGQLLQMTLRAEHWPRPQVLGSLLAGLAEPLPIFPEGEVTQQRQEELETMCTKLWRQVEQMEVRKAAAQAVCSSGTGPPLPHIPHRGPALCSPAHD